jgi:hypothetical protein
MEQKVSTSTVYERACRDRNFLALWLWAAVTKAKLVDRALIPTLDGVYGTTRRTTNPLDGLSSDGPRIYRQRSTGLIVVAYDPPGKGYYEVAEYKISLKNYTTKVYSPVEMIYLSIEVMFEDELSPAEKRRILEHLPLDGNYCSRDWLPSTPTELDHAMNEILQCAAVRHALKLLREDRIKEQRFAEGKPVAVFKEQHGQKAFSA